MQARCEAEKAARQAAVDHRRAIQRHAAETLRLDCRLGHAIGLLGQRAVHAERMDRLRICFEALRRSATESRCSQLEAISKAAASSGAAALAVVELSRLAAAASSMADERMLRAVEALGAKAQRARDANDMREVAGAPTTLRVGAKTEVEAAESSSMSEGVGSAIEAAIQWSGQSARRALLQRSLVTPTLQHRWSTFKQIRGLWSPADKEHGGGRGPSVDGSAGA